jgi:hypothetical protein
MANIFTRSHGCAVTSVVLQPNRYPCSVSVSTVTNLKRKQCVVHNVADITTPNDWTHSKWLLFYLKQTYHAK